MDYKQQRRFSEMQHTIQCLHNTIRECVRLALMGEPSGMDGLKYLSVLNAYETLTAIYPDIKLQGEIYDSVTSSGVPYCSAP